MSEDHEISRMQNEGGMSHPDGGRMDRQAREIERLKAITNIPGSDGVPSKGAEERAIHALLAMATILQGALDDLMHGSECTPTLDRLLRRMQDVLGAIRGVVIIPAEENADLLLLDCEASLAIIKKARGVESEYGEASINRYNAAMHRLKEGVRFQRWLPVSARNPSLGRQQTDIGRMSVPVHAR